MKKFLLLGLIIITLTLVGCGTELDQQASPAVQIANPWQSFDNLKSAEEYAGFELGIPETVSDNYKAVSFSVLSSEKPLLQVDYQDEEYKVEVRKSQDVGQDISGIYGFKISDTLVRNGISIKIYRASDSSETSNAVLDVFDYNGFAWSFYAPNGFWGDSGEDLFNAVFNQ